MTTALLVLALAAFTAPGIHVDEDGFVTITKDSVNDNREQQCIQLMKEAEEYYNNGDYDDIALATMYRNEFESALQDLYPRQDDIQYISKSGWL